MIINGRRVLLRQFTRSLFNNNKNKDPKQAIKVEQKVQKKWKKPQTKQNKAKEFIAIDWSNAELKQPLKHVSTVFDELIANNNLENQLDSLLRDAEKDTEHCKFQQYVEHYILIDCEAAFNYLMRKVGNVSLMTKNCSRMLLQIYHTMIRRLIEIKDTNRLHQILQKLSQTIGTMNFSVQRDPHLPIYCLQILNSTSFAGSIKYDLLTLYLKFTNLQITQSSREKVNLVSKRIIHSFVEENIDSQDQPLPTKELDSFEQLLLKMVELNLFSKKIICSNDFLRTIELIYFCRCDHEIGRYRNLFTVLKGFDQSQDNTKQYIQFFSSFYSRLKHKRLESTDCQIGALPVTQTLLDEYQTGFNTPCKLNVLTCTIIALENGYLPLVQHFIQYQKQAFPKVFPILLITRIRQNLSLIELVQANQNPQNQQLKKRYKKNTQLLHSSHIGFLKLLSYIAQKKLAEAYKLFKKIYLDQACIQKEKLKIQYVLEDYLEDYQFPTKTEKVEFIEKFIHEKLDKKYLLASWEKSEDLGNLYQDYYIGGMQEIDAGQGAEQSSRNPVRFSYWDEYFKAKRAVEIHKLEILNELKDYSEVEQSPALDYHFNLNQYMSPQNYDEYQQLAQAEEDQMNQLQLYLNKCELAIVGFESLGQEKAVEMIIGLQAKLSDRNREKLENFGILNYDITIYDKQELLKRIKTFRYYKGFRRSPYVLKSPYQSLEHSERKLQGLEKSALLQAQTQQTYYNTEQTGIQNTEQEEAHSPEQAEINSPEQAEINSPEQAEINSSKQSNEEVPYEQMTQQPKETQAESSQYIEGQSENQVLLQQQPDEQQSAHPTQIKIKDLLNTKHGSYKLSRQLVDLLRIKNRKKFIEADFCVTMQTTNPKIQKLMEWGVLNRQPMAIYLAQKLACVLGQKIPHKLAIRVSDFLSHSREVDESILTECKVCLSHVGPIKRELIYDSNKDYKHIVSKPLFNQQYYDYTSDMQERVEDLFFNNNYSIHNKGNEIREVMRRLTKGKSIMHQKLMK